MKKSFKLAALFVAAAISVAVVSCQKDKETEEPVTSQSQNSEAKELLNRIYAFQELRDDINSGAKSGESMTLEELRDNIDLTFNFEHSQHAIPFANATLDTFYVRMPQTDANGNVSAADAIATYNAFETSLENLLANVEDDANLAKNFSIKFPETGTKNEDAIEVVFTRGTEGTSYPWFAPFKEGDDYIWGLNGGLCNPPGPFNIQTDAAQELTKLFQFKPDAEHEGMDYTIYRVEYGKFTPYDDNRYLSEYTYVNDTTLTCPDYWLFLVFGEYEKEPCVSYTEMNCYYNSIYEKTIYPNGVLHYGLKGSPYFECTVTPWWLYGQEKRSVRLWTLEVTYAHYVWLGTSDNNYSSN